MKTDSLKPKPVNTISPDVIKMWRERMGYEPQDAIDALGVSASELLDWEQGHRPIPKHIALAMAALAMDLSPFGHQPK